MLRLGFNLWFRDVDRVEEIAAKAIAVELRHAEISLDFPFGIVDKEPFYRMARVLRDHGFTISVHAPWQEIHLASPLNEIRRAAIEITKRVIDDSYRIEAQYVLIHATSDQSVCKARVDAKHNPCVRAAIESLNELASYAEDRGLYLVVENVGYPCCGRIDLFSTIISSTPALACIDIPHAIAMDRQLSRDPEAVEYTDVVKEWASAIGIEKILALHIHGIRKNSDGKIEEHVDLKNNKIDIKRLVKILGRNLRYVVFEIFKRSDGGDFDIVELRPIAREFLSWATAYGI